MSELAQRYPQVTLVKAPAAATRGVPLAWWNRYWPIGAVFVLSLVWLGAGLGQNGLASAFCDPVSRIPAQDEAVYGHEALRMAETGEWLTPMYLGRYALNKPPLLQWLAGASVRVWGPSAWSLRLPSLVAAATVAGLIFALAWRTYSLGAALFSVVLLITNNLFISFSRLCMTDMLLTCGVVGAMFILARDPALERRRSPALFGVLAGLAMMTKGAAGALPLVVLAVCTALGGARRQRVFRAFAAAAAVALPWHLYQAAAHPAWFTAEYILTQHVSVGVTAPPQYSGENHALFYARRLVLTDPVLALAGALSLAFLLRKRRERRVLLIWGGVTVAALFAFRYRSAYYLLPLIPVLAAASGELYTALPRRARAAALILVAVFAGVKAASASSTWGVPWPGESRLAVAPALEQYCRMQRSNDLILIGAEDQFYASDLPLARVRYCLLTPPQPSRVDYAWLGIAVTPAQFDRLDQWRPVFRRRLEAFGLPSDEAVATVIRAETPAAIEGLIERHAEADFFVPRGMLSRLNLARAPHRVVPAESGVLLVARSGGTRRVSRPCSLGPEE